MQLYRCNKELTVCVWVKLLQYLFQLHPLCLRILWFWEEKGQNIKIYVGNPRQLLDLAAILNNLIMTFFSAMHCESYNTISYKNRGFIQYFPETYIYSFTLIIWLLGGVVASWEYQLDIVSQDFHLHRSRNDIVQSSRKQMFHWYLGTSSILSFIRGHIGLHSVTEHSRDMSRPLKFCAITSHVTG